MHDSVDSRQYLYSTTAPTQLQQHNFAYKTYHKDGQEDCQNERLHVHERGTNTCNRQLHSISQKTGKVLECQRQRRCVNIQQSRRNNSSRNCFRVLLFVTNTAQLLNKYSYCSHNRWHTASTRNNAGTCSGP